jgi:hypothetical protein
LCPYPLLAWEREEFDPSRNIPLGLLGRDENYRKWKLSEPQELPLLKAGMRDGMVNILHGGERMTQREENDFKGSTTSRPRGKLPKILQ